MTHDKPYQLIGFILYAQQELLLELHAPAVIEASKEALVVIRCVEE